jgi:hypothetical protein
MLIILLVSFAIMFFAKLLNQATAAKISEKWKLFIICVEHGCQMVYFQTKNPNLGKFWSALQ